MAFRKDFCGEEHVQQTSLKELGTWMEREYQFRICARMEQSGIQNVLRQR